MSKAGNLNKARQKLIDMFLACLEEDTLPWNRGWNVVGTESMYNPISKTRYRGVNAFLLMFVAWDKGYSDPRWCTFKQASDKGWKIKKDSEGVPVEFWSVYDKKNKVTMSLYDYNDAINDGREPEDFTILSRTYTVFNGNCIEGIPELETKSVDILNDIEMNEFVCNVKDNMKVGYREFGNRAYYSPMHDEVTMPPREQFKSQYEFDATLLHELSHATGHESRLNREIRNTFASENYAIEELRAEISSAFLSQYLCVDLSDEHLNNHKAYVQSWAKELKDDPNILFRAIKDAEKISEYIIDMGEMELVKVFNDPIKETESENERLSLDDKLQLAQSKVQSGVEKQPSLNRFKDDGLVLA